MKKVVITIERQYGSGGRTVGEMLANELGIHYYNKELVVLASEKSGISEDLFRKADERIAKRGGIFSRSTRLYEGKLIGPDSPEFTSEANLFNYQAAVIKELADRESCVIIGRAANFILRGRDDVLSVFVHAPYEFLMREAGKKQPLTGLELEEYIENADHVKASYYHYYTGEKWDDARNYDLCLNSGKLGFEKTVQAIKAYMDVRFN
ncbi:MAG: cytidylate kinase-like family protein [Lachnospiraceae bacterium]|nr:cytidylate kinase-like family protein [Lachnospiraceae bacterium]MDN4742311.1 cytidylate kinase-like family protein [Lachnospiraceae bacterium C1.1]